RRRGLRAQGAALWLAAAPLLWLSASRPFADREDRAAQLPDVVGAYRREPRTGDAERRFQDALPRWRELLGTGDFVWRRYRDDQQRLVSLVALFHDTNWKSVHPPRICIEGSNMTIVRDELVDAPWLEVGDRVSRIEAHSRTDSWRYVTLSAFGTADWASGDYWEFVRHHLPRALVRANQSGYLLRVESPIYRGEQAGDAEARCRDFLRALMPSARELVR
ncbi:MAG: exosortase-associated EpsI family protein, partial [Planctomycetota bacterium]